MSTARDYVPHKAAQFNTFVNNIIQNVRKTSGDDPASTNIPQERITLLRDSALFFDQVFATAQATPTNANVLLDSP